MKRIDKILIGAAVCLSLCACGSSGSVTQEEYDKAVSERDEYKSKYEELLKEESDQESVAANNDILAEDRTIQESNIEQAAETASDKDNIEILAEYILPDDHGFHTYHFMIVKNNSDHTVEINTSSIAYNVSGEILGAEDSGIDALGADCTSIIEEVFHVEGTIDHIETEMDISVPEYYRSVIQNLTYTQSDIAKGAVFQVTNNGETAKAVDGYCLFFKDGELVDFKTDGFFDEYSRLETGATVTRQLDTNVDFDTIEFYLDGRNDRSKGKSGGSGSGKSSYSSSN